MHYIVNYLPYSFFEACEKSLIGAAIGESKYAFAIIETIHIMGLTVLLGTMLAVDMSLLGVGRKWTTPIQLAKDLQWWTLGSLIIMIGTGIPLFLSEATRMSRSVPLYYKMMFLIAAIIIQAIIYAKVTKPGSNVDAWWTKAIAAASLFCWFSVALAGRAIAFL